MYTSSITGRGLSAVLVVSVRLSWRLRELSACKLLTRRLKEIELHAAYTRRDKLSSNSLRDYVNNCTPRVFPNCLNGFQSASYFATINSGTLLSRGGSFIPRSTFPLSLARWFLSNAIYRLPAIHRCTDRFRVRLTSLACVRHVITDCCLILWAKLLETIYIMDYRLYHIVRMKVERNMYA